MRKLNDYILFSSIEQVKTLQRKVTVFDLMSIGLFSITIDALVDMDYGGRIVYNGTKPIAYFNLNEISCQENFEVYVKNNGKSFDQVIQIMLSLISKDVKLYPSFPNKLVLKTSYTSIEKNLEIPLFDLCQLWEDAVMYQKCW